MKDLEALDFVRRRQNVVFLGPPGVGKTHLATALGVAAIRAGMQAYFITLAELVAALREAKQAGTLAAKLKFYGKSPLLIVDEVGYLPVSGDGATLFFQLVAQRYERGSLVLTSNKSFREWGEVFGDSVIAAAMLDRLLHHAIVISIRGRSYRLKDQEAELPPAAGVETVAKPPAKRPRGRPRKKRATA